MVPVMIYAHGAGAAAAGVKICGLLPRFLCRLRGLMTPGPVLSASSPPLFLLLPALLQKLFHAGLSLNFA